MQAAQLDQSNRMESRFPFFSLLSRSSLSFRFDICVLFFVLQIPFFPSSLLACSCSPSPRLVTNYRTYSCLPNPLLYGQPLNTNSAHQPSHPTRLKIPPRKTHPHLPLSRPPICSLCHPLQNPTHWTMEPSLHIPEKSPASSSLSPSFPINIHF